MHGERSTNTAVRLFLALLLSAGTSLAERVGQLTQYGITWTFDGDVESGRFANGDFWVVGPVTVVGISNDHHQHGFTPGLHQDGSMVDPDGGWSQGYDGTLGNYNQARNASLPNGEPLSRDNPLRLAAGSSLISAVSWLYESPSKTEPGCPRFNGGTKTPRPVLRAAAVLTCLAEAPPADSFRPPYCGSGKGVRHRVEQLRWDRLPALQPVPGTPSLESLEARFQRPWIDHVHEYMGAMLHPSSNMPQYGNEMCITMGQGALRLLVEPDPDSRARQPLLIYFVQLGIDLAGIADAGGSWPANGGHQMGRKWPILFAGLMLDDEHMMNVGQWKTAFQENQNTFHVSQRDVDATHKSNWAPDSRNPKLPYTAEHIGMPDYGIRHVTKPWTDNRHWNSSYRGINNRGYPGFTLAALIMGQKQAWNHDALFDYVDRAIALSPLYHPTTKKHHGLYVYGGDFVKNMWQTYRADYGCRWVPDDPAQLYSTGRLDCSQCKFHCPEP